MFFFFFFSFLFWQTFVCIENEQKNSRLSLDISNKWSTGCWSGHCAQNTVNLTSIAPTMNATSIRNQTSPAQSVSIQLFRQKDPSWRQVNRLTHWISFYVMACRGKLCILSQGFPKLGTVPLYQAQKRPLRFCSGIHCSRHLWEICQETFLNDTVGRQAKYLWEKTEIGEKSHQFHSKKLETWRWAGSKSRNIIRMSCQRTNHEEWESWGNWSLREAN